uniref:Neuro_bHLH domain-containing protein n=1 Tax=Macrostomum lignano TaxID=282301 RepID=A0A1I8JQT8_9PLAT
ASRMTTATASSMKCEQSAEAGSSGTAADPSAAQTASGKVPKKRGPKKKQMTPERVAKLKLRRVRGERTRERISKAEQDRDSETVQELHRGTQRHSEAGEQPDPLAFARALTDGLSQGTANLVAGVAAGQPAAAAGRAGSGGIGGTTPHPPPSLPLPTPPPPPPPPQQQQRQAQSLMDLPAVTCSSSSKQQQQQQMSLHYPSHHPLSGGYCYDEGNISSGSSSNSSLLGGTDHLGASLQLTAVIDECDELLKSANEVARNAIGIQATLSPKSACSSHYFIGPESASLRRTASPL